MCASVYKLGRIELKLKIGTTSEESEIQQRTCRVDLGLRRIKCVEDELEKTIVLVGGRTSWRRIAISDLASYLLQPPVMAK